MDLELYILVLIGTVVLCAGFVQSVTGFGFGIFSMIFLPHLLLYSEANAVASTLSAVTSALVLVATWRKVNLKNLVFPLIGCLVSTYLAVQFIKSQDNRVLTLLLGVVLTALSAYFFFFSDKIKIKPTPAAGLIAGLLSGILEGMFSIGGPPVVIYYLQSEEDTDSYLATVSAYFVCSGAIAITTKALSGFYTVNVLWCLLIGLVGLAAGALIGKKTRAKVKPAMIKKAVYAVMAVSGIVNIVTAVVALV